MATVAGEKVIYIVNGNTTTMGVGTGTVRDQSRATRDYHAAAWGVTAITYEADFGVTSSYSPTDAVMRAHALAVSNLIVANPTATHVICSSHTPGIAYTGKWVGYTDLATNATGEAFDAWFGAAKYMKSGTGWTLGTGYMIADSTINPNEPAVQGPKRYLGSDTNYLPYGRIGHWQFGAIANPASSGVNDLIYENPILIRRIIDDAISQIGNDATHALKAWYPAWDTAGSSKQPCLGANKVASICATRGFPKFFPWNGLFGGYGRMGLPGDNFQNIATVPCSFPQGTIQVITSPGAAFPDRADWIKQVIASPVWYFGAPWDMTANGTYASKVWEWCKIGLARGAWMCNQSSIGANVGVPAFLYNGGCLAQGTVSEPSEWGIISYQHCIEEFMNGRTWAEACLVAAARRPTCIGKMGVYGDPLAQHFKLNNAVWS
jgi:hypothetical protein